MYRQPEDDTVIKSPQDETGGLAVREVISELTWQLHDHALLVPSAHGG